MAKTRKVPQRMCVGCKEMKIKKELIRIVRNTEGVLEIDTTGKKSGRGAYICPNLDCLDQAVKVRGIQKALGKNLPNELQNDLKEQIEKIRSNI